MDDRRKYHKGPNLRINQVRLSESLHSKLKEIAERDDRSLSYVIRKACEELALKDDLQHFTIEDSLDIQERIPKPMRSNREASSG